MMKNISISEDVYEKIKNAAEKTNRSIPAMVEYLVKYHQDCSLGITTESELKQYVRKVLGKVNDAETLDKIQEKVIELS